MLISNRQEEIGRRTPGIKMVEAKLNRLLTIYRQTTNLSPEDRVRFSMSGNYNINEKQAIIQRHLLVSQI